METPLPHDSRNSDQASAELFADRLCDLPQRDAWQQAQEEGFASLAEWIEAREAA